MEILIGLGVLFIAALVAAYLSAKNWHWGQVVLVFLVFASAIGFVILASDVLRKHKQVRTEFNRVSAELARLTVENRALLHGTRNAAIYGPLTAGGLETEGDELVGIRTLESRLADRVRTRGPVWRNIARVQGAPINTQTGAVTIVQPPPPAPPPVDEFSAPPSEPAAAPFVSLPGLEAGMIVFAFEQTHPSGQPLGQYLGEFQVTQRNGPNATIQPVLRQSWAWPRTAQIDERIARLGNSNAPWILYDSMPSDRYDAFAGVSEEELRALLPAATVEQYVRHGQPAGEEIDPRFKIPYDKTDGLPLTDEEFAAMDSADVEWRYQRPLRDYSLLFQTIARQRIDKFAEHEGLQADTGLISQAQENADAIQTASEQAIEKLEHDRVGFTKESEILDEYVQALRARIEDTNRQIAEHDVQIRQLAAALAQAQLEILRQLNEPSATP